MSVIRLKKIILLIGDIALLYTSLFLTLVFRYRGSISYQLWLDHLLPFSLLFIIWIIVFFINNLYTVQLVKNDFKFYGYLVQNLIINTIVGFAFFYIVPLTLTTLKPIGVLIILVIIFAILFLLWRKLFYSLTSSKALSNKLMLIGINSEAIQLAEAIERSPQFGYKLSLIVNIDQNPLPQTLQHIPHAKDLADLVNTIKKNKIQTVVTVPSPQHSAIISRYLFETLSIGISYYTFPDFYEKITGKVPVASLEKDWFLENLLSGNKHFYELNKRVQDITAGMLFGILSLPLVPFIILGIKLTSPGPLLFKQTRTGKGGKGFMAMKFRTMVLDAEQNGPQWAAKNDPRITKLGKFLRKTRLDEIPQFINILKGDMSFVGPRPERPEFVALLSEKIPFYKERLLVKPGLSGWAQINFKYGDSIDDAMTKLQYDLFYIKNRTFTLDISIILKTINTVLNATLGQ